MIDEFKNPVDPEMFAKTNERWNFLQLNHPRNVGYVVDLIERSPQTTKEEWEDFYYLNGRSAAHLMSLAKELYDSLKLEIPSFTLRDSFDCVRFRVICETWNGIVVREQNTIKLLTPIFAPLIFKKTIGSFDFNFGVDYELCHGEILLCGIQIKPQSYENSDKNYLMTAREANAIKNNEYTKKYGVPVYTICSESNGTIVNHGIISRIMKTHNIS